jgi:RNA recognition motif-containing protein
MDNTNPETKNTDQQTTYLDHTNVFVKYLPGDIDNEGLRTLFAPYGEIISSKVMIDHRTGLSLGYGYEKRGEGGREVERERGRGIRGGE